MLSGCRSRHGKFRPTLMKLVSSNEPDSVKNTVQEAMQSYREGSDAFAAVDVLTKLKGIGPATASLLLAVHDPGSVIFFADEAFYWLCCDGKKESAKYNTKEYKTLSGRAASLAKRLNVKAVDIERVAFVIVREHDDPGEAATKPSQSKSSQSKSTAPAKAPKKEKEQPEKRKISTRVDDDIKEPLRRSKRGKKA